MALPKYFKFIDDKVERGVYGHTVQIVPVDSMEEADIVRRGKHLFVIDFHLKIESYDPETKTMATNYG